MEQSCVLEMKDIHKSFGGLKALDGVNLDLRCGGGGRLFPVFVARPGKINEKNTIETALCRTSMHEDAII